APSLAGSEPPEPRVGSDRRACLVDDPSRPPLEAGTLEERAIVVTTEEAGILALGSRRGRKAGGHCLGPRLRLGLIGEWERDSFEQNRIERGKHVALILGGVTGARERKTAVALDDAGVVAGREPRRPDPVGKGDELVETK